MDQNMKAFDFFSQIYCSKFEEGHFDSEEVEREFQRKKLGVYAMLSDIRDEDYSSPSSKYGSDKVRSQGDEDEEVMGVLWWIAFVVSTLMCCLYCVGLYFTYFEDEKSFEKSVRNDKVPGRSR